MNDTQFCIFDDSMLCFSNGQGGYLEEEELRAGRDPVTVAVAAAEGGLHLHLHSVLQLGSCHLGQAVVVILKQGLWLAHRLVVLQS